MPRAVHLIYRLLPLRPALLVFHPQIENEYPFVKTPKEEGLIKLRGGVINFTDSGPV